MKLTLPLLSALLAPLAMLHAAVSVSEFGAKGDGVADDTRAGCGISIDSDPAAIAHMRIEGITIRDCILQNLSLYRARQKHPPAQQRILPAHAGTCCVMQ